MKSLNDLKIQIYADGADKAGILDLYAKPYIKGLTTNPTLMNKAGLTVPNDIPGKAAKMDGRDLTALSLDTVKMFAKDAIAAGY